MDWDLQFLNALRESRSAWDEPADWRAALVLYDHLSPDEAAALDRAVLAMIAIEYRNPHAAQERQPFDDLMVNLPAGMSPEDLLCIEAAVLVAAERGLGEGFFAFNRLMRLPTWHILQARLEWLPREGFEAQRRLGLTRAGRAYGALLGLAVGDALGDHGLVDQLPPTGWPAATEAALDLARAIIAAPTNGGGDGLAHGLVAAVAYGPATGGAACQNLAAALLAGATKQEAAAQAGAEVDQSLSLALQALLATDSPEACIAQAASHGSQVAALTGGLAGAHYGPSAIPRRWSLALTGRPALEELAEALHHVYQAR